MRSSFALLACMLLDTTATLLLDTLGVLVLFANKLAAAVVFAAKHGATLILAVVRASFIVAHCMPTWHHVSTV